MWGELEISMKVGLIQVDGKMPNLALMKLAAFHKKKGDDVTVLDMSHLEFDRVYASKVFVGGSGVSLKCELPSEIEAEVPDYEAFKTDYSIGFSSRGCMKERGCSFCIVKPKEGLIREAPFDWVSHHKVVLLDNNFLASPLWKEKLNYFIRQKLKVCFTQGLDIRLINSENAKLLSQVLYYDLKFNRRRLYFAFDDPSLEPLICEKVKLLNENGIPSRHLLFYVLVGYNTDFTQDYHRFEILNDLDCLPFIMLYNGQRNNANLRHFARWINKRYYHVCTWEAYCDKKKGNGVSKQLKEDYSV